MGIENAVETDEERSGDVSVPIDDRAFPQNTGVFDHRYTGDMRYIVVGSVVEARFRDVERQNSRTNSVYYVTKSRK